MTGSIKTELIKYTKESELPPMPMHSCTMHWNKTGSWRYLRPKHRNKLSPCVAGCPGGENIEGWIRLMQDGKYDEALSLLRRENPFPGICGRVCFHPCELTCNRKDFDRSVSINNLERFLWDITKDSEDILPFMKPKTGKKVAIVGSGPAGLSCAYQLARLGHSAIVYESAPKLGGVLRLGIPAYRLPREVLDKEINYLKKMGIEFKVEKTVGKDVPYSELDSYDAVFIAYGVHKSKKLGAEGEHSPEVMSGLDLLRKVNLGQEVKIGERVAVVGGGNTAIDAARAAIRLGKVVTVFYRRTREEMPAFEVEVDEAQKEGVSFSFLTAPLRVVSQGGKMTGVEMARMELGTPDESGRRRPVLIKGSNFFVPLDTVVTAIGEETVSEYLPAGIDTKWGDIVTDVSMHTSKEGYYAGGDIALDINHTVIDAIATGKRAAIAMDCKFNNKNFEEEAAKITLGNGTSLSMAKYLGENEPFEDLEDNCTEISEYKDLNVDYFKKRQRSKMPILSIDNRLNKTADTFDSFKEVHLGLSKETAEVDLDRCFHCGRCTECDNCYYYCPDVSISRKDSEFGYDINLDYCKGCGVCIAECPRDAMEMNKELR